MSLEDKIRSTEALPGLLSSCISRARLLEFLDLPKKCSLLKPALIARLIEVLEADNLKLAQLLEAFVSELAVSPPELEQLLGCTTTERRRWVEEGKIPILELRSYRKGGSEHSFAVFDRRVVQAITPDQLEQWRQSHLEQVHVNRRLGARSGQQSRERNRQTRQRIESEWRQQMQSWISQGSAEVATILILCFWTVWASRWAKENQWKAKQAIKHPTRYQARRKEWYARKDQALRLLARTPYCQVRFYRPGNPDKLSLHLCDDHHEMNREFSYPNKWVFFADFEEEVSRCKHCLVDCEENFYSLYYLEVKVKQYPDLHFSFHIPYGSGKLFLPSPTKLTKVVHEEEQDGLFCLGRALLAEEKIAFREQDVLSQFEQALDAALKAFPAPEQDAPKSQGSMLKEDGSLLIYLPLVI